MMLGTIYYCDGAESEMVIFFIALLSISDKLLNYKLEVLETFLPTFSKFEKKKKNLFFFFWDPESNASVTIPFTTTTTSEFFYERQGS